MTEKSPPQEFFTRVPIEEKIGKQQTGRMKVGAQIIEQLSKGVYSTPEMAIKELISNSFDADATEVIIDSKSSPGSISIKDNGHGMDYKDFDENYVYISRSPHIGKDEKTPSLGRPVIGRLGIGFLAVSQLCDTMVVSSAKKGSKIRFVAVLNFGKFKDLQSKIKEFNDISEYVLTNYEKKDVNESYTYIELKDLTEPFQKILENTPEPGVKLRKKKKMSFQEIVKKIWASNKLIEVSKTYGPYWKFVLNLASIIPVEYLDNGPIKDPSYSNIINPIRNNVANLKFKVYFDKMELRKPYLLPTPEAKKKEKYSVLSLKNTIDIPSLGSRVSYSGYVYNQDGNIPVNDWRGLIIRVKNTSVGIISQNFFDYPHVDTLYFKWTFGEIYVDKGLEEAMNIDRATFKKQDPEYDKFILDLHDKLQSVVFESVQSRYRSRIRKKAKKLEDYKINWREKSLSKTFGKKFEIKIDTRLSKPVSISTNESSVYMNDTNKILNKFPRRERELLKDVILAAAIARERYPSNVKKQEELFLSLLAELAENYPKTGLKFEYQRYKK